MTDLEWRSFQNEQGVGMNSLNVSYFWCSLRGISVLLGQVLLIFCLCDVYQIVLHDNPNLWTIVQFSMDTHNACDYYLWSWLFMIITPPYLSFLLTLNNCFIILQPLNLSVQGVFINLQHWKTTSVLSNIYRYSPAFTVNKRYLQHCIQILLTYKWQFLVGIYCIFSVLFDSWIRLTMSKSALHIETWLVQMLICRPP